MNNKKDAYFMFFLFIYAISVNAELIRDTTIRGKDTIVLCSLKTDDQTDIITFKNGKKDGIFMSLFPDGKIMTKRKYDMGCEKDTSFGYHANGALASIATHKNCEKHGKSISFSSEGDTTFICTYQNGKRVGLSRSWYTNGNPKKFTEYGKNGKENGIEKTWWEDGTPKDSMIMVDGLGTTGIEYYRTGGKRIWYKDCYVDTAVKRGVRVRTIEKVTYAPDGSIISHVKNGNGILRWYSPDGKECKECPVKERKEIFWDAKPCKK